MTYAASSKNISGKKFPNILKFFLCLSFLPLVSCTSFQTVSADRQHNIEEIEGYVTEFPETDLNTLALDINDDRFKVGDLAEIDVYNVEDLSRSYIVDRTGNIRFPLIGSVEVAGLSPTDLQDVLTEEYGAKYLESPNINVTLEAKDLGRVIVDGAVNKPGVFDIRNVIRLTEAVALAQGIDSETSNGAKVYVIRTIEGRRSILESDLREIRNLQANDPQIIPNDVVFVEDSTGRLVFREFLRTVPLLNTALIFAR